MLLRLLALPVALPISGSLWLARQVAEAADRERNDPARLRAELERLERELEAGTLDEAAFEAAEAELIDRLQAALGERR